MKVRVSATALLLSIVTPALLTETGLPSPLSEPSAFAQGDQVTEIARQRYEEGVKAFDAGKFEDARAAFLQAYALKRHPAVLLNLGQSELRSGHYEDAGNHLQQFLRLHTTASAAQKTAAEKGIADAKKKTGFVIVIVDANGADVSVDGTSVGRAPFLDPVFVKPGKRTLVATYQNKSATTQVDAKVGAATMASLTLGTSGGAPAPTPMPAPAPEPTPVTPAPTPAPVASAPVSEPPPPPPSSMMGSPSTSPDPLAPTSSPQMGTMGSMEPDQVTPQREPFLKWYTQKPLAWVGTGVAAVGLGLGVTFSIAASRAGAAAQGHAEEIKAYLKATNQEDLKPCASPDASGSDAAGFEQACDVLREDLSDYDTDVAVSIVGWALLGVGVVGTTVYAMVDWYPGKKKKSSFVQPEITAIAPVVSPTHQGIGILGTF
jgi:hypothetical protein